MPYRCIQIRPEDWEYTQTALNMAEKEGYTLANVVQPSDVLDRNRISRGSIAMLIMYKIPDPAVTEKESERGPHN